MLFRIAMNHSLLHFLWRQATSILLFLLVLSCIVADETTQRQLGKSYYVTGLGYDSYATAWRFLGTYLDCDSSGSRFLSYYSSWRNRRSSSSCQRKLLWAAYYDPNYKGKEIGEYQFYDGGWDTSTCKSYSRCAKMDCHDPYNSNWQLIGVYKEPVTFEDDTWFEQLFKHQGYCLWDGDKEDEDNADYSNSYYQFMQTMRQEMPQGCTKAWSGVYTDIKPLENGEMTLGLYRDSACKTESSYSFSDYQKRMYSSSYTALKKSGAFDTWNALMDSYKICQPCRAYNRQYTYQSWDHGHRDLRNSGSSEQYDGQGDEERYGFNCYDDADYRNCNQCFKFETHTSIEEASSSDLSKASNQGTILKILVNGAWYGSGLVGDVEASSSSSSSSSSSRSSYRSSYRSRYSFVGGAAFVVFGMAVWGVRKATRRRIVLSVDEGTTPSAAPSKTPGQLLA